MKFAIGFILSCFLLIGNLSSQSNIVTNGDFESGLSEWAYWFDNSTGYFANFQTTSTDVYAGNASGEVDISNIGSDVAFFKIMVKNTSFSLTAGQSYDVSFYLRSDTSQDFVVEVHRDSSPFTNYASHTFFATPNWQEFTFTFESPVTTADVRFAFKLGTSVAHYYFDNIHIAPQVAQTNTGLFDTDYTIDWSDAGIIGGIPTVPNAINVLNYGAVGNGVTNNLVAFQNALAAAQPGQAVFVPAGTYAINGSLKMPEGVVLRGECPSNTKLIFNVGTNLPCIEILTFEYGSFRAVTGGFGKGSTSITAANNSNINVGDYIQIQQDNDPVLMYTDPRWDVTWAEHSVGQLFKVIAVNGNTIGLDRPIYYGFNPALSIEVRPTGLIENVGIENLYLERLDANDDHIIEIKNAANCWVRNVESNMTFRSHVDLDQAIDCTIRDSYFHHSHDYGGGGHAYGVNMTRHVTSCLVENNIFETLRHAMLVQVGATGNVFAYNYSTDPYWSNSSTNIPPDISMHGHFPTMNLFESNIVQEATFSDFWGPLGPGNTMFRNRVEQSDIAVFDHSHNQNIVANELTSGDITIHSSVLNTWSHSNNENGTVANTSNAVVPASLYLNSFPPFLNGYAFPTLGFGVANVNSIPAKDCFDTGMPLKICECDNTVACVENCPIMLDDAHLGGGGTQLVLPAQYVADHRITSSGVLQNGSITGFHANGTITLLPGFSTAAVQEFVVDNFGCTDGN